ncbi:ABC-type Na+ efflux pump permease subunit [Caldanaerobacter subterraneus subsp. tengcongensis MB4]|uniref:Uncharacterized protein n=3 Tax=Caldanaerobacter subterraneus TaxID=911092 RepID=Q8RBJ1_CALS4|nr:YibE/F family protein [Caldanaerobacter subterraneus]AAM24083.1 hypothetical protein TTE0826 [Caldanaerobacter subterraneus subsp. tengcongensis MB4]ERM91213.1 hypothetical protein O163_11680 [Caldanaerobacter subterraneus subsp. yonseiensis KB-1]MCS3916395.1 ABC-type Na+ efflux pump permease subunit [Caldanaerobacter subterraneus subsp. tengcongensis MB4]
MKILKYIAISLILLFFLTSTAYAKQEMDTAIVLSAIPLLLLFMAYQTSLREIINLDIIATEIVRSLAASTGLVAVYL